MTSLYVVTGWSLANLIPYQELTVTTDIPVALNLLTQTNEPSRAPKFKTRRGVRINCGVTWHWPNPTTVPPVTPGPALPHVFRLPYLTVPTDRWVTTVDGSSIDKPTGSLPPIPFVWTAPPPVVAYANLFTNTGVTRTGNSNGLIVWTTVTSHSANWNPPMPDSTINPPFAGTFSGSATLTVFTTGVGNMTAQVRNFSTGAVYGTQTISAWPGTNTFSVSFLAPWPIPTQAIVLNLQCAVNKNIRINPAGGPGSTFLLSLY